MTFAELFSNKKGLLFERRKLRKNGTKAEQVLWQELKQKKAGYKFRRQFQIGRYIVDFYSYELKLIIEVDGPVHAERKQAKHDKKREKFLQSLGNRIIRYTNDQVLFDREALLQDLKNEIEKRVLEIQKRKE